MPDTSVAGDKRLNGKWVFRVSGSTWASVSCTALFGWRPNPMVRTPLGMDIVETWGSSMIDTTDVARACAIEQFCFGSAMASMLPSPSRCAMPTLVIRRMLGCTDVLQQMDFTRMVHAHLENPCIGVIWVQPTRSVGVQHGC